MSSLIQASIWSTSAFRRASISVAYNAAGAPRRCLVQATATKGSLAKVSSLKSTLSALSNAGLLRSLLVATVSSKPSFLRPTLTFLSWLAHSPSMTVWNAERNPVLRSLLKNTFYKQFCAGESATEIKDTLRQMKALGFRGTILTCARETIFDQKTNKSHGQGVKTDIDKDSPDQDENIAAWRRGTLETVDLLEDGDQLALK